MRRKQLVPKLFILEASRGETIQASQSYKRIEITRALNMPIFELDRDVLSIPYLVLLVECIQRESKATAYVALA